MDASGAAASDEAPVKPAVVENPSPAPPQIEPEVPPQKAEKQPTGGVALFEGVTLEYVVKEVLLGTTIGFAQVPESVAFAFLANIKPPIALHAAWMVGLICSLFGGRPGMVNGATGAFAAIIGTFIPKPDVSGTNGEGVELLFPSVMLAGILMFVVSALRLSRFILLLPSPVMIGFCNGLAIVIGNAQLHPFKDAKTHEYKEGWELFWMLVTTFVAMATMEFVPKIPLKILNIIPSSLLAILMACLLEFAIVRPLAGSRTDTIGDVSEFTDDTRWPIPFFVDTPATDYDLSIIWPRGWEVVVQGILLCTVGVIESLMTSEVVESFVKTPSDGDRTVLAMGVGNVVSGFFGGMGGNAMIGLSTINALNGGKGRLAPTCTALLVMISIIGAYPLLNYIPVSALAGIMLVVVIHTFKWFSLKLLFCAFLPLSVRKRFGLSLKIPRIEVFTIVLVTILSIVQNIAVGVLIGTAIIGLFYSWKSSELLELKEREEGGVKIYDVEGPIFFVSANLLLKKLKFDSDPDKVEFRFGSSCVMDYTAVETLNKISIGYRAKKKTVTFKTLSPSSQKIISKAEMMARAAMDDVSVEPIADVTAGFKNDPLAAVGNVASDVACAVCGSSLKKRDTTPELPVYRVGI